MADVKHAGPMTPEDELTRIVIFIRADCWYPIRVRENEDLAKHAELNPGTLRIDDIEGNVLWRRQWLT